MDLSIVIPTYNERDNVPKIVGDIFKEFKKHKIKGELIIVDDNSPDGTGRIADSLTKKYNFLRVVHRKGKEGLSSAVLEGFKVSKGKYLGVMDADLSHPVEKIHELYEQIDKHRTEIVIGSRYASGGAIKGWNLRRKLMSQGATYLARVFTKVKDPMSGFFMMRKEVLQGKEIDSKGFKILLEIIIKTGSKKIKEIPIVFINRKEGKSKANIKEVIDYLRNLAQYAAYKKELIAQFGKFALVGLIGTFLNIFFLYIFTEMFGIYYILSAVFAFVIALSNNYLWNKTFTFGEDASHEFFQKFAQFTGISLAALGINLIILYVLTDALGVYYLVSQFIAIGLVFTLNFLGNKIWTFSE